MEVAGLIREPLETIEDCYAVISWCTGSGRTLRRAITVATAPTTAAIATSHCTQSGRSRYLVMMAFAYFKTGIARS